MTNDNLTLDQERRALKITEQAWQLPERERQKFVTSACDNNETMMTLVQELLTTNVDQGFLNTDNLEQKSLPTDYQNTEIGAYRVSHCIARGGMGDVYLAERVDGQFEKQVAIKFIRHDIDTGLERRFAIERQILAKLQHPNIAQLLDSGITGNGKSYYVMEYIDGLPIDVYCQCNDLQNNQVINIFIKICDAISAAHRQLTIHRDLKPENILVTKDGEPKVLDFGVAKILHRETPPNSTTNQTTIHPLTPRYASPEQLRQDFLGPATDIYSLGVILYELLTGLSPYGVESPSPLELNRRILEHIPKPPTRVSNRLPDSYPITTRIRQFIGTGPTTIPRLRLASDVDAILLKALEKEPQRRYASVEEFKSDLTAVTQKLPVKARTPSPWYRLIRFSQRHKYSVTASILAISLLIYAVVSNYINLKAIESQYLLLVNQRQQLDQQSQQMQQQKLALQQQEQALLEEQRRLAQSYREVRTKNQMLQQQREQQQQSQRQLITLDQENEELKQAVERLAEKTNQRINRLFDSTLQYYQLLNAQYWPSSEQALATLQQQQVDAERVFANQPEKKGELLLQLASLANRLDLHSTALTLAGQAMADLEVTQGKAINIHIRANLLKANSSFKLHRLDASESYLNAAINHLSESQADDDLVFIAQLDQLDYDTQLLELTAGEQQLQRLARLKNYTNLSALSLARYYQVLGDYYTAVNQIVPAGQAYQQALKNLNTIDTDDPYSEPVGYTRACIEHSLSRLYYRSNDFTRAIAHLDAAHDTLKQHIGWNNLLALRLQQDKINVLLDNYEYRQVDDLLNRVLPLIQASVSNDHPLYWEASYQTSRYHQAMGLYDRALDEVETAVTSADSSWHRYGHYLMQHGDVAYALGHYEKALTVYQTVNAASGQLLSVQGRLSQSLARSQLGLFGQAHTLLSAIEKQTNVSNLSGALKHAWGLYWELQGEEKLAMDNYEAALRQLEEVHGEQSPATIDTKLDLSRVMLLQQRIQSAKNLNKSVLDIKPEILPYKHPQRVTALKNLTAIETITHSYGRKRRTNELFIAALDAADESELTAPFDCYYYLVEEYNPKESKLFAYWFLQNQLFTALPNAKEAYSIKDFAVVTLPFDYSTRMRRELIDCFAKLSENSAVSEYQRAVAAGYVGGLYLADNSLYLAKAKLEMALQYFAGRHGAASPRARYLAQLLQKAQY